MSVTQIRRHFTVSNELQPIYDPYRAINNKGVNCLKLHDTKIQAFYNLLKCLTKRNQKAMKGANWVDCRTEVQ